MSLIATLIPVTMLIANIIDDHFYDSWVVGGRISLDTDFKSKNEIISLLKTVGCRYEVMHDAIRIYCFDESTVCYFAFRENKWVYMYSKYDDEQKVKELVAQFAKITNKISFYDKVKKDEKIIVNNHYPNIPSDNVKIIPTKFMDFDVLEQSLKQMDVKYNKNGMVIWCEKNNVKISFFRDDGMIKMRFVSGIDEKKIFEELQDLDVVYCRNVQKKSYDYIKNTIMEKGLELSCEEVLADDTILLTIDME